MQRQQQPWQDERDELARAARRERDSLGDRKRAQRNTCENNPTKCYEWRWQSGQSAQNARQPKEEHSTMDVEQSAPT
jgi:hypothetical protein